MSNHTTVTQEKQYRIIESFDYRGKDGSSKINLRIGPGEKVPVLNDNLLEDLLAQNKIVEIDKNGKNIYRQISVKESEFVSFTDNESFHFVNALITKPAETLHFLKINKFTLDTLEAIEYHYNNVIEKSEGILTQRNMFKEEFVKELKEKLVVARFFAELKQKKSTERADMEVAK